MNSYRKATVLHKRTTDSTQAAANIADREYDVAWRDAAYQKQVYGFTSIDPDETWTHVYHEVLQELVGYCPS
ncbi:MAG: hypothetical protein AAB407_03730 [Patescibacteria group bacterium]